MRNGAYFITDTSWEKYIRKCAKNFGENETWIQNVLNGGDGGERAGSFRSRSSMWTAVYGESMTVFGSTHRVYQFTPNLDFYTANYFNATTTFILNGDILTY